MTDGLHPSPSIQDVRNFWDRNPLWTGEGTARVGTQEFFEEHHRVYRDDCFAGSIDGASSPSPRAMPESSISAAA